MENSKIHHLIVTVNAAGHKRFDKPVDLFIDNEHVLQFLSEQKATGRDFVRVNEIDQFGNVVDPLVPCQYDLQIPAKNRHSRISFLAKGVTQPDQTRYYDVIFDATPTSYPNFVEMHEIADFQGQPAFKIITAAGIYYYHQIGGGIASLFDPEGRDWVGYRPTGGSDGKYRGIPNLKYPEAHFHPGSSHMNSKILGVGPIRVSFRTSTPDTLWSCLWDIWPTYATVTVERADQDFWFLYEGTPGGALDEVNGFIKRSDGTMTSISEKWETRLNPSWLYFGARELNRVLFLAQHENEETISSYWPMEKNMTVFGFGRQDLNHYLQKTPARFTIGLIENCGDDSQIELLINSSYQDIKTNITIPTIRPSLV